MKKHIPIIIFKTNGKDKVWAKKNSGYYFNVVVYLK